MKLRARLAWTALAAALPVVAATAWMRARFEWKSAEQALVEFAVDRMENGGREACEEDPGSFPPGVGPRDRAGPPGMNPPRPGMRPERPEPRQPRGGPFRPANELWAYAPDFRSANPRAPPFPDELRSGFSGDSKIASARWRVAGADGIQVAVRMPWEGGPCAVVLARRPSLGPPGAVSDLLVGSLVLCAVLLGAVMLAAGPLVERVRRLTGQVRQSAATRYASGTDVGGSDEIAELARAYDAAATEARTSLESLESRERALRSFVENTTHDVMIPLTVLQGHLTVLRRKAEAGAVADREVVVDALQEAHYMASLIQNLAAAARLESGELGIERHFVDLNALVERVIARHAPIAKAREIHLEHAVPPEGLGLEGDVTLVEQAVSNLIHNAVRYVEPGGHVAVVLEGRGPRFSLRVLDDGPGIPESMRQRVFERSFRADGARSRHPAGMGLGLSIAKDIADRHGFTLELRRSEAGGAELELSGPVAEEPPQPGCAT